MTNHNNAWSPMVSIIGDKSVKSATHTSTRNLNLVVVVKRLYFARRD